MLKNIFLSSAKIRSRAKWQAIRKRNVKYNIINEITFSKRPT